MLIFFSLDPSSLGHLIKDSNETWRLTLGQKKQLFGVTNRIAVGGKPDVKPSDKQGAMVESMGSGDHLIHSSLASAASSVRFALNATDAGAVTFNTWICPWTIKCAIFLLWLKHFSASIFTGKISPGVFSMPIVAHHALLCQCFLPSQGRRRDTDEEPVAYHALPLKAASYLKMFVGPRVKKWGFKQVIPSTSFTQFATFKSSVIRFIIPSSIIIITLHPNLTSNMRWRSSSANSMWATCLTCHAVPWQLTCSGRQAGRQAGRQIQIKQIVFCHFNL